MTTTFPDGRLGNQIIRNIAVSLLAEKSNLHVTYSSHALINELGIDLFCGTTRYSASIRIDDLTYMKFYNMPFINRNLGNISSYFQTKEIIALIYKHLHSDSVKNKMMEKNPFSLRYQINNDACVHIRLGDIAHFNPGLAYYLKTLSQLTFDRLYLTTDQKDHEIIQQIQTAYPNSTILEYDEIRTFQFASTCKHIILSHGSFSAVIGYLAYFSDIYYPEYESNKMWYGDMFSIPGWNKMSKI